MTSTTKAEITSKIFAVHGTEFAGVFTVITPSIVRIRLQ
jgi:hypothetical protein